VRVERHETEAADWEVARRDPPAGLRGLLLGSIEGWAQTRGLASEMREVPFPGIPLILNLGAPWEVDSGAIESFVAGLGTSSSTVRGAATWACVELRLTPLGAYRMFGVPMSDLTNRAVALDDLVPEASDLDAPLRDAVGWTERFDLVDEFLLRRLASSRPIRPEIEWSWHHLYSTRRPSIGVMANEIGWSHRRLIARFREQIGLTPKLLARVVRFDRAATALRAPTARGLAEIAYDSGYADQAHLTREFRELAGLSPKRFRTAVTSTGPLVV
jgi:AraC-like DNA-binding protein